MLAEERRQLIASLLKTEKRVNVGDLAFNFNVSEETIRRDLEKLEIDGIARRTYGGALFNDNERKETPYDIRKRSDVQAKCRIAELIASLICDGEYIMLDESSTSFYIASKIKHLNDLTIITNSMEIVTEVSGKQNRTVLCTGGVKRPNAPSFAGHQAENMVRSYHVDKTIISCCCIDTEIGFTDRHEDTALLKTAMMASAKQVILAVDSSKFGKIAFASIGKLNSLDYLVTDSYPGDEWSKALRKSGVKLICPSEHEK